MRFTRHLPVSSLVVLLIFVRRPVRVFWCLYVPPTLSFPFFFSVNGLRFSAHESISRHCSRLGACDYAVRVVAATARSSVQTRTVPKKAAAAFVIPRENSRHVCADEALQSDSVGFGGVQRAWVALFSSSGRTAACPVEYNCVGPSSPENEVGSKVQPSAVIVMRATCFCNHRNVIPSEGGCLSAAAK